MPQAVALSSTVIDLIAFRASGINAEVVVVRGVKNRFRLLCRVAPLNHGHHISRRKRANRRHNVRLQVHRQFDGLEIA
jgi:hypothetical protein